MLVELRVKNFGIIEDITWSPGEGLNVITGETGAGKSLVIDAVESLLSGRIGDEQIRHQTNEATLEGIFYLNPASRLKIAALLAENGQELEDDILIIRLESKLAGRSVLRLNGSAISRSVLSRLCPYLIDIHGQSEHLSLLNKSFHLDMLDGYAHTTIQRTEFARLANELTSLQRQLSEQEKINREAVRQQEFLRFQADEIEAANLAEGEEESLLSKRQVMASTEKLKTLVHQSLEHLCSGQNGGALADLNQAMQSIRKIAEIDPALKNTADEVEDTYFILEESIRLVQSYNRGLDFNPSELEDIENRLALIHSLERKYGRDIPQILAFLAKTKTELDNIGHFAQNIDRLGGAITDLKSRLGDMASSLSALRKEAAQKLEKAVQTELSDLNMGQVIFKVNFQTQADENGLPVDGQILGFSSSGTDLVEFFVSTNPGEPLRPLNKIASTGEISRITLALKSAASRLDDIPVMIFDEIDIGVGGRSGDMLGRKLWKLSQGHQLISVSHLPQIAAYADHHFYVSKTEFNGRINSHIEHLNTEGHLAELSVMLSGNQTDEKSLENARELLKKASIFKETSPEQPELNIPLSGR
ncbi:DNA repair protein RecN [Dehalococcoides mccartyi]|uniref:DNA repair protein RecN n=1 Tax=Dehalococcoides mccartyi TaxID=61435 RepID=UPI00098F7010|nr:DNA repair protein RecN [Dehalococcoides mccartyi]AQU06125.1 DNA repair protein RecN [Dehalococcoides mccartyi]AQU07568.1 DNA repair protein RecN [Dehalococcoides mccartyi]